MLTLFLFFVVLLLSVALAAVVFIWLQANNQLKKYDAIDDVESYMKDCATQASKLKVESGEIENNISSQKEQLKRYTASVGVIRTTAEAKAQVDRYEAELRKLQREIGVLEESASLQEVGFYQRRFSFEHPDEYKRAIKECVTR